MVYATPLCSVLPIGAEVLPRKVSAQGLALAPIALATRPEGAPLTVTLRGERMPGTEDGPLRALPHGVVPVAA
jgi:hypothetical protein